MTIPGIVFYAVFAFFILCGVGVAIFYFYLESQETKEFERLLNDLDDMNIEELQNWILRHL